MAKRKRSSRRRTSRRNHSQTQVKELERAARLVATWKKSYVEKHGRASEFARVAEQATARLHELLDEGVPLKRAYTETVHFFNEGDPHLADFADDCVHLMSKLIREDGLTPTEARVAVLAGAGSATPNRRRRRSRRAR